MANCRNGEEKRVKQMPFADTKPKTMEAEKCTLRAKAAARRRECPESEIARLSAQITARIIGLEQYTRAEVVFAYMALPKEVQTRELILRCLEDGKRVGVPKVQTEGAAGEMHFYEIRDFDHLLPGPMHLMEPDPAYCPCLDQEEEALVILPGVAYDRALHRLGYGGGFYDRYLQAHEKHPTAAVAFDFQVFDEVPSVNTDIRPQILVTPQCILQRPR